MQEHAKKNIYKKILLLALLLILATFSVFHWDIFYIQQNYGQPAETKDEISISGSQTLEQEFHALENEIVSVSISFKAWEQKNGTGKITVELQTMDGEVLASCKKSVKQLKQGKKNINTKFPLEAALEKGESYKLVLQSKNVNLAKGCYVYNSPEKGDLFGELTVNGEPATGRLAMTMKMTHYGYKKFIVLMLLIAFAMLFVLLTPQKLPAAISRRKDLSFSLNKLLARLLFAVAPLFAFFIVQSYAGYSIASFCRLLVTTKGKVNLFLYYFIWAILYLICNRTKYTAAILVGATSIFGLTNYFVWNFRGEPIMFADIMSINTAMKVSGQYEYTLDAASLQAIILSVVFIVIVLSLESYKGLPLKKRLCALAAFCIPYSVFYTQLLHGTYLKEHKITVSVWAPSRNYAKNGSLLSFFISYTYYRVDEPNDYSAEKANEIAEKYISDSSEPETSQVRPNVIAIMNEAFSDLSVDGPLALSEDYMPYIRNLTEDTVKGRLYVSILGGNTANTEFEFLTGCSLAFMPFQAIPYNTYIKDSLPSLTTVLKEQGYSGNYAIHPFSATAWNRNKVYPLLGFEEFYSLADFDDKEYVRNFLSDKTDFEFVISKYEEIRQQSDDPIYLFNVTVQNHGGYRSSQGLIDTPIKITSSEQQDDEAEQYINLIKLTDNAFKNLTEYFKSVEEPTVIVMFGDHQPSLPKSFYESLIGKPTDSNTLQDTFNKYSVPYIIWANYDIEEEQVDMSANYLSSYLMKVIGGEMSGYQKYLLDLFEQIPILTAKGYCGNDGVLRELDEESQYTDLIEEYKILQYNNVFDSDNRIEQFYKRGSGF